MAIIERTFEIKREEGQNPYIGIMSFQHFRGEKLYSDIVVRPEANRTETERVECYPPSADAAENGRAEGYYPDNTVAYIRVLWKEFEPERGVYNYAFIEDILKQAKEHKQKLLFRLMAHSTREEDDVPEWLKSLIPCPARPKGERIKESPTDPLFLELFLAAVKALGARVDSDPAFYGIDISLPGAWGEGCFLDRYPAGTLERIVDVYIDTFKNTQLFAQASRPELIRYAETKGVHLGWRGDGLGEPEHTFEVYPQKIEKISDVWMHAPVSFESYWWLGEWKRQGWDIRKIADVTLGWHISSLNPKSLPIPNEWQADVEYWLSKMGYHFTFDKITLDNEADAELDLSLEISNIGVAPIYVRHPFKLRLVGAGGEYVIPTELDIKTLFPGKHTVTLKEKLPEKITSGRYTLEAGICDDDIGMIYFATDAERDGNYYKLAEITVK